MSSPKSTHYVGRFAPSPTGELHFGSLVAAVGSYLQARSNKGKWLIRVEDIDPPREVPGSADRIITDLARFGMQADEPVLWQGSRSAAYEAACRQLLDNGRAFFCRCSRRTLPESGIYPGTCRNASVDAAGRASVRARVDGANIGFTDGLLGEQRQQLSEEVGDFVIHRSDGLPAYQLAVVVDDAFQGVTEVVRGADLLDSTARQIFLQCQLGLPTPRYLHLPVATTPDGRKLGKRFGSDPVNRANPVIALSQALRFLGHAPPDGLELDSLWSWAIDHWRTERIPRLRTVPVSPDVVPVQ